MSVLSNLLAHLDSLAIDVAVAVGQLSVLTTSARRFSSASPVRPSPRCCIWLMLPSATVLMPRHGLTKRWHALSRSSSESQPLSALQNNQTLSLLTTLCPLLVLPCVLVALVRATAASWHD